ncbi:uncharacterized protein LOC117593998 [Esox lucius]|uniref:uncharacterized protein LOC117593998 n=1 Tax=Esox lucius TaxID=8010 RepID=UPI001476CB4F|nr:uncharacterized protein LOC117593998 [Esox lucius]
MAQFFGEGSNETNIVPLVRSQSNNRICDQTLNEDDNPSKILTDNSMTTLSSEVLDLVFDNVLHECGLLDSPSRPHSSPSYHAECGTKDMSSFAGDLIRQVSIKLQTFVSDSQLSTKPMTSLSESLSDSTLKQLCSCSAFTTTAVCQAIKTELENELSLNSASETLSKTNLAASNFISTLLQTIEDIDVADILQGPLDIFEEAALINHPELSKSMIYRSLLIDSPLPSSAMVTKSIIYQHPQLSGENVILQKDLIADDLQINCSQPVEEYIIKAEEYITQVIQDAALTYTATLNEIPSFGEQSEILSVSPRNIAIISSILFEGIIADLRQVSQVNKTSTCTKSGRKMFWEAVSSGSKKMYAKTLDKLNTFFRNVVGRDFGKTAKETLSQILKVIKSRVVNSESSREECLIATNMLNSLLESLEQLPDACSSNETQRKTSPTSISIDSFAQTSVRSLNGQVLGMSTTRNSVMDQVTKTMTPPVFDSLTEVSSSSVEHVIVPRWQTQARPTTSSTSIIASDITDSDIDSLGPVEELLTRNVNPSDANADGMSQLPSAGGKQIYKTWKWFCLPRMKISSKFKRTGKPKKHSEKDVFPTKKMWRFLTRMPKIPKIRIKVFMNRTEPVDQSQHNVQPTKCISQSRISLDAEFDGPMLVPEVLSTSPPKEDPTPKPPSAAQGSQSRKCPFLLSMFRGFFRPISCFSSKKD